MIQDYSRSVKINVYHFYAQGYGGTVLYFKVFLICLHYLVQSQANQKLIQDVDLFLYFKGNGNKKTRSTTLYLYLKDRRVVVVVAAVG